MLANWRNSLHSLRFTGSEFQYLWEENIKLAIVAKALRLLLMWNCLLNEYYDYEQMNYRSFYFNYCKRVEKPFANSVHPLYNQTWFWVYSIKLHYLYLEIYHKVFSMDYRVLYLLIQELYYGHDFHAYQMWKLTWVVYTFNTYILNGEWKTHLEL